VRDASEKEEPNHQHQFFVHEALVGNSGKMLPAFKPDAVNDSRRTYYF
jgi:hypothetical protein